MHNIIDNHSVTKYNCNSITKTTTTITTCLLMTTNGDAVVRGVAAPPLGLNVTLRTFPNNFSTPECAKAHLQQSRISEFFS